MDNKDLPPFTLRNVLGDIRFGFHCLLFDPFYKRITAPIIIFLSSILTKVVIAYVPYTEIDFKTYIQQIHQINAGQLDYSLIEGDSGPIVYPAGFVHIFQVINWITSNGENVVMGQILFGYLFTATVAVAILCYASAGGIPLWPLMLLLASRRLVSVYVLRMFNDGFTTGLMVVTTLFLQVIAGYRDIMSPNMAMAATAVAADVYSTAIAVKMNALLYLPGVVVVVYYLNGENLARTAAVMAVIPAVQWGTAWRFVMAPVDNAADVEYLRWTYFRQAFQFDRKFLYQWTVNWRFVPQEVFESGYFTTGLMVMLVVVMVWFGWTRFAAPFVAGKLSARVVTDGVMYPFTSTVAPGNAVASRHTGPRLVMLILSCSNIIGVVFCRSLHYQFLSWYCWQMPFMLWATGWKFWVCLCLWMVHEWCWNVFPSTEVSSGVLVGVLLGVLVGVWRNKEVWEGQKGEGQKGEGQKGERE